MKVSIITICYNSQETLEATIQSVISQDYQDIEYILVDGASSDGTLDLIKKYEASISKWVSEPDKGIYDAMNKGVQLATGELVGILNSDDFYENEKVISKIAETISANQTDSIYADLVYVDRVNTDKIIRKWTSGKFSKGAFLNGWMPPHPTFFLKKKIYNKHGVYSLDLKSAADYELMLRMLFKHDTSTCYLPEVITKMRVGGESNVSLKNRIRANKEDRKAWKMNDLKPRFYTLFLKPIRKISQFFIK